MDKVPQSRKLLGVVTGWRWHTMPNGMLVTFTVAASRDEAIKGRLEEFDVILSAEQVRRLGDSLTQQATALDDRQPERPKGILARLGL